MNYVISYDVGTSSVKTTLIGVDQGVIADALEEYPMICPREGWVEQKPKDYWTAIIKSTHSVIQSSSVDVNQIRAMIFSTQSMGIIPVDKDGNTLRNNISWVDGRAQNQAENLMRRLGGKTIFTKFMGIELTGKDVAPKLMWFKAHQPELYAKTHKFLDVNGYLKFKCTGQMTTEWSAASAYGFDLKKKDWERLFFMVAGIDVGKFPELTKSTDKIGQLTQQASMELGLPTTVSVYGGCDDTQSAALGTGAIEEGQAHIYLGTSAWVGVTTQRSLGHKNGAAAVQSAIPDKNLVVAITEMAGGNILWFLNTHYVHEIQTLGMDKTFELFEKEMAQAPVGSDHLIFTPWFLGERAPVSSTTTRATLFNISHVHTRSHMARALCEGIAYNLRWSLENLEKDYGFNIKKIRLSGGGSKNDYWMQILADITQCTIEVAGHAKWAGSIGVSVCAYIGEGIISDFSEIHKVISTEKTFHPINPDNKIIYDKLFIDYKNVFNGLNATYKTANLKRFNKS